MSTLQAEQICGAVATALAGLVPATVARVDRQRAYPLHDEDLPHINILMGADRPVTDRGPDNLSFQDWELTVYLDITLKSTTVPLETALNSIRLAAHKLLLANYTLGLNFVFNGYAGESGEPEEKGDTEMPVSVMRVGFIFMHRALIADPSSI